MMVTGTVSSVLQRESFSTVTITAWIAATFRLASSSVDYASWTTSTIITESDVNTIYASQIEVRYKESDSVILSLLAELSPTSATLNSQVQGGGIAGIVIGALVALALMSSGAWFLSRRKRAKRKHIEAERDEWHKAELEAKTRIVTEMAGEKDVVELEVPPALPVELASCPPVAARRGSIIRADEIEAQDDVARCAHTR